MPNEVVPFGKYQGKTFKAMVKDRKYVDWLLAQPWFREQFRDYYSRIVGEYQQPSETPEHNAFQARFLDLKFQLAFLQCIEREIPEDLQFLLRVDFESHNFDVYLKCWYKGRVEDSVARYSALDYFVECKPTVADEYPAVLRQIKYGISKWQPARGNAALLLGDYQGVGVTRDQFVQIFNNAGIAVVFMWEIEELLIPRDFFGNPIDSPSNRE